MFTHLEALNAIESRGDTILILDDSTIMHAGARARERPLVHVVHTREKGLTAGMPARACTCVQFFIYARAYNPAGGPASWRARVWTCGQACGRAGFRLLPKLWPRFCRKQPVRVR